MKSWFTPEESLNAIKNKLNFTHRSGWERTGAPKSGTSNMVEIIIKNSNPKNRISIRTSKEPVYIINQETNKIYNKYRKPVSEEEKNQALNNESNWNQASKHKLSPQLYFYGYYKTITQRNLVAVNLCVISKGYTSDLTTYFRDEKNMNFKDPPQGWVNNERRSIPGSFGCWIPPIK